MGAILLIGGGDIPPHYRPANLQAQLPVSFAFSAYNLPQRIRAWLLQCWPDLLKQLVPTILHIHQANSIAWHMLRATKALKIATLLTCYGSDILQAKSMWWRYQLLKKYLKRVDYVTVASYEMARIISPLWLKPDKLSVLNFGVSMPHKVFSKRNYVLSNRLHKPLYRIDALLYAWQKVEAVHQDWHLLIAGHGSETCMLKNLSQILQLKQVKFVGLVSEQALNALYRFAAIFVSVPNSDAVSLSLFEAMAHGCIPVVSNIAGNVEAIRDGVNGIVHPHADLMGLSDSILRAIILTQNSARMDRLILMNRQIIRASGLRSQSIQRFIAIYHELCSI